MGNRPQFPRLAQLDRWVSTRDSRKWALELGFDAAMALADGKSAQRLAGPTFILVRPPAKCSVETMLKALGASALKNRLGVLFDTGSVGKVNAEELRGCGAACVLDVLASDVSFAAFSDERLAAIRFSSDFVTESLRSIRGSLLLESMLHLARELGLLTLGQAVPAELLALAEAPSFDYVLDNADG